MDKVKASYRVPEGELERVRCAARYAGLDVGRALVVDMTDVGLKLAFPTHGAPDLPLGKEAELSFKIDDEMMDRRAVVRGRIDSETDRIYDLRLLQTGALRDDLGRTLISAFNLRGAFRVSPDDAHPISATVTIPDRGADYRLDVEDISATGLAGHADSDAEEVLCRVTEAVLNLNLDGDSEPVTIDANIVGREIDGIGIRYRFSFCEETARQERQVEKVMDYIMARQRNLAATTIH